LPGNKENSISVLRHIADEISTSVHISLMSQYNPLKQLNNHPLLGRKITKAEYDEVVDEMENLGFFKGWVQDLESSDFYNPDFINDHPFEMQKH